MTNSQVLLWQRVYPFAGARVPRVLHLCYCQFSLYSIEIASYLAMTCFLFFCYRKRPAPCWRTRAACASPMSIINSPCIV
jgi:hypothetical protein